MKKIILLYFIVLSLKSFAQNDIGLNFSKTIWQSNIANAAFMPKNKIVVALPSVYFGYHNTFGGFSVSSNLLKIRSSNTRDFVAADDDLSLVGFGFAVGKNGYLTFSQTLHTERSLSGSGDLFKAIVEGNAQFIGKTIDVSPNLKYSKYNEFAAAYAHNLGKLTVGGRIKLFTGLAHVQTGSSSSILLSTDSDAYQLTFDLDYKLQASKNIANVLGDLKTAPSFSASKFNLVDGLGMGLDLSATYDLTDKITLGASANNLLASIKWKGGKEYATKTKFNIDGVDIVRIVNDSTFSLQYANLDTVVKNMNFRTTPSSFRTSPSRSLILTGSYKVNNFLTTNALLAFASGRSYAALNATANVKNWLEAGLTYSIRNRSFSDLGANIAVKIGPVQAYCIADNFLATFKPLQANNFSVRVGANLVFGTMPRYSRSL